MSDASDEDDGGTLVRGPWSGDSSYVPPPMASYADTIPPPEDTPYTPPESPEETTMELPSVPSAPDPAAALRSEGNPAEEPDEECSDEVDGEYVQPRSLADRIADWIDYRISVGRARHEAEMPLREAEIAQQVAQLEKSTQHELALKEQRNKLHQARLKAQADRAAARGKGDSAAAKSGNFSAAGMGADKGRGKPSASGTGATGRGAGGRGAGPNGSGGGNSRNKDSGRDPGGRNSPKGGGKGSGRFPDGRNRVPGGKGSGDSTKGRQNGFHGSGSDKGSKGGSKGANRSSDTPASNASPAPERRRGRQERAANRQAARLERRGAHHAAGLADRTKDRDQARAQKLAKWEDHRAAKAERDAERKAKKAERDAKRAERKAARRAAKEAAAAAGADRTTLGAALVEEAQRRWDKRREGEKDGEEDKGKTPADEPETKAEDTEGREDGEGPADAAEDSSKSGDSGAGSKAAEGSPEGAGEGKPKDTPGPGASTSKDGPDPEDKEDEEDPWWWRHIFDRLHHVWDRTTGGRPRREAKAEEPAGPAGPVRADAAGMPCEWPGHETRTTPPQAEDDTDYPDAEIVGPRALSRAPEPHTEPPGTTRPTAQESSVTTPTDHPEAPGSVAPQPPTDIAGQKPAPGGHGQSKMAAQHRAAITIFEFMGEMKEIFIRALHDRTVADKLAEALIKMARELREWSAELACDDNIVDEVTDDVADMAADAVAMAVVAGAFTQGCKTSADYAFLAHEWVDKHYGEDVKAMKASGLGMASAASHH